ncbi:MAG: exo-alpha-sialidase [Bacteroidota bacterium]
MKKKLFSLILLSFGFLTGIAQPVNTNISNGVIFDGEPYVAVNPTNPQNLVAAWMGIKLISGQFPVSIRTRASFDGGNTWSTAIMMPHFGSGFGSADPSMAFDKNGLLYVCYIDYRQSPDSGGVYVARSHDGGLTWDSPSKAFDAYDVAAKRPIDRPWLVVDNSNTPNFGTLYITTKPAPWIPTPNRNYYKVSLDSGHTWSTISNVDGGTHLVGSAIAAPMATPATTVSGKFCAVYPSYVGSQNVYPAYYLATSADKGQTFSYTTVYSALPGANDTNYKNGYQLITHPTDSNKMVFLSPDALNGDDDIMAYSSTNGGQTWATPVRVNDDTVGNGKGQDMVWGAYNEQGNIIVTWRDRRSASANGFWNAGYDFYYAISTNNGQTFSANQKLSSQFVAFDTLIVQNGNDFMSCVYRADTLYAVWGDTRNSKMNIYFTKVIVSTNTNVSETLLEGEEAQFRVFPNPALKELQVTASEQLIGKDVAVFDVSGKMLYHAKLQDKNIKINIQPFENGIYFLKIGNEVKRFVKG